ncbi:MAG: VWA domain-containing protein [Deltaproteobacteria bacterium]|nr:VWA domain-containing protein [Deltaproteobacteria bacterium]
MLLSCLACGVACTGTGLEPYQPPGPQAADDRMSIFARACTSPAVDTYFPVKILFVVDTSLSMSVTDRGGLRAQAVLDVLTRYAGNPAVKVGVVAFDARVDVLTDGFTSAPDLGRISSRLSMADRLTDYQGALGAAYSLLSSDMLKTSPAERARSKYVVIFFTDGTPDPQCSAQADERDKYAVCEVPRRDWTSAFNPPLDPSLYPGLEAGGDYNQPRQVLQAVDDIVALQEVYRVGELRLHSAFLFDPEAAADPLARPFGLDRAAGVKLLTDVAERGDGTFTEFSSATRIGFLNVDYTSIKQENALAGLIATNENALPGAVSDTDGDGLSDAEEIGLGTCVGLSASCEDPTDTDGDGFSDFVEEKLRLSGLDPLSSARPTKPCGTRGDSDGDGLLDCEEALLGTDPRLFDSDADRVPDAVEVKAGLDPTKASDAMADADGDGMRNAEEVRGHLSPLLRNRASGEPGRYLYETGLPTSEGGRTCYDLAVRNIQLLTTGRGSDSPLGRNRIYLYFLEAPPERPLDFGQARVACMDARYVDGKVKSPPSGRVTLTDLEFVRPEALQPDRDCVDLTAAK